MQSSVVLPLTYRVMPVANDDFGQRGMSEDLKFRDPHNLLLLVQHAR